MAETARVRRRGVAGVELGFPVARVHVGRGNGALPTLLGFLKMN